MSAIGDLVSVRPLNSTPNTLQAEPPEFGKVVTVDGSDVPTRVIWFNLKDVTLAAAAAADLQMDTILAPLAASLALLGKVVLPITGSNVTLDPSGGTSREYAGTVVQIYGRRPIEDDQAAQVDWLLAKTDSGLYIEGRVVDFVELPGR